jgi:hypothetical protein
MNYLEIIADNFERSRMELWAGCQPWILTAKQFELLTLTAMTVGVLLCARMKS